MVLSEAELESILKNNPALRVREADRPRQTPTAPRAPAGDGFESDVERRYYNLMILPQIHSGHIVKCDIHKTFEILPAVSYQKQRYQRRVYTPDFYLEYRDGAVVVIEIKGRVIKKLQRDYPLRRQLFILRYCIPNNWTFIEVHDDEI